MTPPTTPINTPAGGALSAGDAAAAFGRTHGDGIGWWYDQRGVHPFRCSAGALLAPDGTAVHSLHPHGLVLFNPAAELTWTDDPGDGVTVSTRVSGRPPAGTTESAEYPRLLWGEVTAVHGDGWVDLFDGRVGRITVPVGPGATTLKPGDRAAVYAVEYQTVDQHGNVAVTGERLTRIAPWARPTEGN